MKDVAEYYGFAIGKRTRKICCPFHQDSNPSMQIYSGSRGYYCFVCGAGGDIIDFVMRLFGLSFTDACKKLDQDFHLNTGINVKQNAEERRKAEQEYQRRINEINERKRKKKLLYAQYFAAYNRYTFLDVLMMTNKPTDPDKPVSKEYVYACKRIDAAWQDVVECEKQIRLFDEDKHKQDGDDSTDE